MADRRAPAIPAGNGTLIFPIQSGRPWGRCSIVVKFPKKAATRCSPTCLSDGLKTLLSPLEAVHDAANIGNFRTRDQVEVQIIKDNNPPIVQPVMRQHPETGKPALYVTESATTHFVGMTAEESRPILKYLFKQSTRDEFIYRHRWRVGDLIMWDNRCTLHRALMDYSHESDRRHMLRTTILGEASGTLVSVSRRG